jgi:hypothetical protein
MVFNIVCDQLEHQKRLNSEPGREKTVDFPFWAKSVVAKKGSWWYTPKNTLKTKLVEPAEAYLNVFTVW